MSKVKTNGTELEFGFSCTVKYGGKTINIRNFEIITWEDPDNGNLEVMEKGGALAEKIGEKAEKVGGNKT
mgnify:CR=1 FL=1